MATVTQVVANTKQPYGGYLNPKDFEIITFNDNYILKEENIHSSLVGLCVDYLTRYMLSSSAKDAFEISLLGARNLGELDFANELLLDITGLDDDSIYAACKMVGYDVCYRRGLSYYKDIDTIKADQDTISNIRIMVNRNLTFFEKYGPIVKDGFTFEGAYNNIINAGDGDYLTKNTLWDLKVTKSGITSKHTLQLLIYYIMGKKSIHSEFDSINSIGIFNPRKNVVYFKKISDIDNSIIEEVSSSVIGYTHSNSKITNHKIREDEYDIKIDKDSVYTMYEIMRLLGCSREKVIEYSYKKNLPLFKSSNRYYSYVIEFNEWVDYMAKKAKRENKINLFVSLLFIILVIFFYFYCFYFIK